MIQDRSVKRSQSMKRVRFQTPNRGNLGKMEDRECHSPRPFMQKIPSTPSNVEVLNQYQRLPYFDDPVERYESSDSSPYLKASKTQVHNVFVADSNWKPSNDLELSILDASSQEPRQSIRRPTLLPHSPIETCIVSPKPVLASLNAEISPVLSTIQNENQKAWNVTPPNVLSKENSFFIRRDNLDKYQMGTHPSNQFSKFKFGKENCPEKSPATRKAEMFTGTVMSPIEPQRLTIPQMNVEGSSCRCHHCVKSPQSMPQAPQRADHKSRSPNLQQSPNTYQAAGCPHCTPPPIIHKTCQCHPEVTTPPRKNAVDKKTWAIQKFENGKSNECLEVSKQTNVTKEKREPTVADLFKIIKLQNEQLQLLQEKVDKFLTGNSNTSPNAQTRPAENYVTEHVALQTIDHAQHKISIGVMTSFEMVRTSTVINKEIVTHTTENAQIQCNRSQISIKEVVTKPVNSNFLDGLAPNKAITSEKAHDFETVQQTPGVNHTDHMNDEKTLNEMSLYNVQVDNATTPQISPEQSMYLDVRDYSDSESSGHSSPVGWTYYNKVMTHVNGMLQDSEMPSSASAMYRNARQQFVQMHIDKTNVSVTKRVKFGDDPLGIHQPHLHQATTDTSLKMNQLAAKYLSVPSTMPLRPKAVTHLTRPPPAPAPMDMSLATRNYMERHKLIKGTAVSNPSPTQQGEMPRFLDITALKKQTKLL